MTGGDLLTNAYSEWNAWLV